MCRHINNLFGVLSLLHYYFCKMHFCSAHIAPTSSSSPKVNNAQALEQKVLDLFDSSSNLPLSISRPREGIEVRTKFEGDHIVTIAEAKMMKKHPDHFKDALASFNEFFPKMNPMVKHVHHLVHDKHNCREGVKSILKFPYPLKNRVMISWKYPKFYGGVRKNEHLLIFSEEGNKDLLEHHFTSTEKKEFELARTFLCAFWVKPVYDSENNIIMGTTIRYAFSGDTGGSIPKWIQNAVGPKTALDSVRGLINHAV